MAGIYLVHSDRKQLLHSGIDRGLAGKITAEKTDIVEDNDIQRLIWWL